MHLNTNYSVDIRFKVILLRFLLVALIMQVITCCGPGRSGGRTHKPRKLKPLVFKQFVPNVPEKTLGASGPSNGRVRRSDHRFKELVPNYNSDIVFKDEEGNGEDRLMTQRLKERLNTLAVSVMNLWPGTKLRVTESWDSENIHHPDSLHYEGRAVDITTSDRDRSKYGMLARLAVEAGFDWVYYETREHVHCSVKSESSQAGKSLGCFSSSTRVQIEIDTGIPLRNDEQTMGNSEENEFASRPYVEALQSDSGSRTSQISRTDQTGPTTDEPMRQLDALDRAPNATTSDVATRSMSSLQIGDRVLTLNAEGNLEYSEVIMFMHRDPKEKSQFLRITTQSGINITITPSHLILRWELPSATESNRTRLHEAIPIYAKDVRLNDTLLIKSSDDSLRREKVTNIDVVYETGVYAPLTATGTIVVNGVVASCYAVMYSQRLAHLAFAPYRLYHLIETSFNKFYYLATQPFVHRSQNSTAVSRYLPNDGIHWYCKLLQTVTRPLVPHAWMTD